MDDELAEFWRLLAPGTRALVVADSCFSGGSVRKGDAPMAWHGARPYGAAAHPVYRSAHGGAWRGVAQFKMPAASFAPAHDEGIAASVLLLASTGEQQHAKEGVYVGHLLDVRAGGAFRGSFRELHERVSRLVKGETHDQDPQILMVGTADPGFPLETAFHLDRPVMRGGGRPF